MKGKARPAGSNTQEEDQGEVGDDTTEEEEGYS